MNNNEKPKCKCANCFDVDRYMYSKDGKVVPNTNVPEVKVAPPKLKQPEELMPWQYTFEEWMNRHQVDPGYLQSEAPDTCNHNWNLYQGLNFDDFYCTKCGQTKPANPAR